MKTVKTERLEIRISPTKKKKIKEVAEKMNTNLTELIMLNFDQLLKLHS